MNKKKEKKILSYATVAFAVIGLVLLSYGVYGIYSSNPSLNTLSDVRYLYTYNPQPTKNYDTVRPAVVARPFIASIDLDALDQFQDSFPSNMRIGMTSFGSISTIRQTGYNDREPLNGFLAVVAKHGTPPLPLYIGIVEDIDSWDPSDAETFDDIVVVFDSSIPADTYFWIGSDNQVSSIRSSDEWSIILISFNLDPYNYWMWGCDTDGPYGRGRATGLTDDGWVDIQNIDMTLATFTVIPDDPDPDPDPDPDGAPVITITTTPTVIPMFFGGISLLAAVVTGIRYFWIGALL